MQALFSLKKLSMSLDEINVTVTLSVLATILIQKSFQQGPTARELGQFKFRNGLQLHIAGAFIDLTDLSIPVIFFNGIFCGEAIAAK